MIAKWIDIDDGAWRMVVNYDVTLDDMAYIAKQMREVGASQDDIDKAYQLFFEPNHAFTLSDYDQRMSLVCIGWATSRVQWHNSIVHEIDHVQSDICGYYGVELGSEKAAYLQGALAAEMLL